MEEGGVTTTSKARPPSLSRASQNRMVEWLNGVLIWNLYYFCNHDQFVSYV